MNIPIHDYVREIYEKYEGNVPGGLSVQTFNQHLKNICRRIGFTEPVTFNYTRGGNVITETRQKWELISSHSARRSFATNAYLTNRLEPYKIMAITGHTTEKSFFRYIKVTKEDLIKQIANDNFFEVNQTGVPSPELLFLSFLSLSAPFIFNQKLQDERYDNRLA